MITIIESKTFLESTTQAVVNFVDCSGNAINFYGENIFKQNKDIVCIFIYSIKNLLLLNINNINSNI